VPRAQPKKETEVEEGSVHAAFWYGMVIGFVAGFATCTAAGLWVLQGVADLNSEMENELNEPERDGFLYGQLNVPGAKQ
jgi:hypothetical protein